MRTQWWTHLGQLLPVVAKKWLETLGQTSNQHVSQMAWNFVKWRPYLDSKHTNLVDEGGHKAYK